MSGQTKHWPVKTSNLPDKCPMISANLQACYREKIPCSEIALIMSTNNLKFDNVSKLSL